MSSHTRGPRKRSRKPRPAARAAGGLADEAARASDAAPDARSMTAGAPVRDDDGRRAGGGRAGGTQTMPVQTTFGERPRAPWHPLPLSEMLILAGAIGAAVGLGRREFTSGLRLVLVGIGAVVVGTIEVTWREHRAGYRSHTLLLSFLPVVVLHSAILLAVGVFTAPPRLLNVGLLAVDVGLFLILFRVLRARFLDARARAAVRR